MAIPRCVGKRGRRSGVERSMSASSWRLAGEGRAPAWLLSAEVSAGKLAAILSAPVPELPDVTVYVEALRQRLREQRLAGVRLKSPFLLRTVAPPLAAAQGRGVTDVRRRAKRIVLELGPSPRPDEAPRLLLVLHLMIAGRLHWKERGAALAK